ncbi:universal stress protein [Bacillus salacetis]|uniref:Universal stress protein n=1 Tax=Bacillus salacetis TaxID=2315464 RepID=A0A3A1QW03_9BACI|nr:universal stress protein [Bacillus salacetis]RIW30874.1 universal stress protein [Bacillus salacetis]
MYKRILLAADGSEHSKRAAENAVIIARCSEGSVITVVYVADSSRAKADVLENWNSTEVNDFRKARLKDIEVLAKEAGVRYEIMILHGEPGPAIVEFANKHSFDIAVVGSRGLNGLQEFVLGSVSHKVAKRANCPVLIVK